jgi:hypothetical protein
MSDGLKCKYILKKADGRDVDPEGIYFVLKVNSKDQAHARASRMALKVYADEIEKANPTLHNDIYSLLLTEQSKTRR